MFILEEGNGEENMTQHTLTSTNISSKDLCLHNNNSSKFKTCKQQHAMTVIACSSS